MALANATVGATDTTIHTSANADGTGVVLIALYNSDSVSRQVTCNVRPAGEAVALENTLFKVDIPSDETFTFTDKIILSDTDVISAKADVGSVVAATASYLDL